MATTIDERVAYAMKLHERGFNCAQCVAVATADLVGIDPDTSFRTAEGFGSGMGEQTETCGAISGGVMALGFAHSHGMDDPTTKADTRKLVTQLVEAFRQQNGSTICDDLKGTHSGTPLRSCDGCIEDALRITCDLLNA